MTLLPFFKESVEEDIQKGKAVKNQISKFVSEAVSEAVSTRSGLRLLTIQGCTHTCYTCTFIYCTVASINNLTDVYNPPPKTHS